MKYKSSSYKFLKIKQMKNFFFIILFIIFYAYIGYGLLLWFLNIFIRKKHTNNITFDNLPPITLIIPAYNELSVIDRKMQNSSELIYPKDKLTVMWVTDGSNDGSNEYLQNKYANVVVLHENQRKGKASALNRGIENAKTEIVVFCDANTFLNKEALIEIVKHFNDPQIGVVAGEKRVLLTNDTAGIGESLYWKYESWLKKLNSDFHTAIGAVGELFAIRKSLAVPLPVDTVVDDFVLSMQIASKGYKIVYEPKAYATEEPSENEKEEMKRKVRIAAGAFQTLFRYPHWLNFFSRPLLAFQYFSYKVLRWIVVPLALPMVFLFNIFIVISNPDNLFFLTLLVFQLIIYSTVLVRIFYSKLPKFLNIPYYFILMNLAQYLGFWRYITKKQPAAWEKVKRKTF